MFCFDLEDLSYKASSVIIHILIIVIIVVIIVVIVVVIVVNVNIEIDRQHCVEEEEKEVNETKQRSLLPMLDPELIVKSEIVVLKYFPP